MYSSKEGIHLQILARKFKAKEREGVVPKHSMVHIEQHTTTYNFS